MAKVHGLAASAWLIRLTSEIKVQFFSSSSIHQISLQFLFFIGVNWVFFSFLPFFCISISFPFCKCVLELCSFKVCAEILSRKKMLDEKTYREVVYQQCTEVLSEFISDRLSISRYQNINIFAQKGSCSCTFVNCCVLFSVGTKNHSSCYNHCPVPS